MKYSFSQVKEALNNGKVICFQGPKRIGEHRCYLSKNKGFVEVLWYNDDKIQTTAYSIEYVLGNFNYNIWAVTNIEGEETMENKTTPHKHAELIKKWADGAIIQYKDWPSGEWVTCDENRPAWIENAEYRVKPTKVTKFRWVFESALGDLFISEDHYSELEAYKKFKVIQKVYSTMIEVEE